MTSRRKFFDARPTKTIEADSGVRNLTRAAPVAQVRLRCTNPVTPHKFRAAYKIRCPICAYGTIVVGHVPDPLTKRQGSS